MIEINSNYGHLIWSEKYFSQYENAVTELENNPDSRRASMIYTRPSIWQEYNENGKNEQQITSGLWEVTSYYGYDKNTGLLFYNSTQNGSINRDWVESYTYIHKKWQNILPARCHEITEIEENLCDYLSIQNFYNACYQNNLGFRTVLKFYFILKV